MFKSVKDLDRPRRFYAWTDRLLGKEKSRVFWEAFRKRYITEKDIMYIKENGFNSIRLPIDYEILFYSSNEKQQLDCKEEGFLLLDQLIQWCNRHELFLILDLHAAPGGQTGSNIDNSENDLPELYINEIYQYQTIYVWEVISKRYKDEAYILGYDLLNEPLPKWFDAYNDKAMPLYQKIIHAIRKIDQDHIISLEGVHWATDFSIFKDKPDHKILLQFHKYWSHFDVESIAPYMKLAEDWKTPLWMGEGGEHNLLWYSAAFKMYNQLDISWCFWSYKKMETNNSIVSFKKPLHWDRCLNEDTSLSKEEITATFNEFLESITFESSTFHEDVINHLFQNDEFETYAIAFDYKVKDLREIKEKNEHVFRLLDDVVCVDDNGKIINPDFSIHHRDKKDFVFPYLKMEKDRVYDYTFYVSKNGIYNIGIICSVSDELDVYIDQKKVQHNMSSDDLYNIVVKFEEGKHTLSLINKKNTVLKKIKFTKQ